MGGTQVWRVDCKQAISDQGLVRRSSKRIETK